MVFIKVSPLAPARVCVSCEVKIADFGCSKWVQPGESMLEAGELLWVQRKIWRFPKSWGYPGTFHPIAGWFSMVFKPNKWMVIVSGTPKEVIGTSCHLEVS